MNTPPSKKESRAQHRDKVRDVQFDERKARWLERKKELTAHFKARYGRDGIKGLDLHGKPLASGDVSDRDVPGEDVALGLKRAFEATGDPVFADALAALESYGLARGKPRASYKAASVACFGDPIRPYLANMKWLLEHRPEQFPSIRAAAEEVASRDFVNGSTFEGVTKMLREHYAVWEKADFPDDATDDLGDIGLMVNVRACDGRRVTFPENPSECIPDAGITVPFTTEWRRRFQDGDITISRIS